MCFIYVLYVGFKKIYICVGGVSTCLFVFVVCVCVCVCVCVLNL